MMENDKPAMARARNGAAKPAAKSAEKSAKKPATPKAAKPAADNGNGIASAGAQRKRLRQVELLLEVSRRMAAYDTLDEILNALVEVTTEELGAERGTLFLNDAETHELFSRVAQGNIQREIRFLNHSGIAGHVFTTGEAVIIADAYADARFNRSIDEQTGFVTRNILCVPIKTFKGEIIGVSQTLNKRRGKPSRAPTCNCWRR
jgi:adenylate cyclase